MRITVCLVAILIGSGEARADDGIDSCKMYEDMAGSIMWERQKGMAVSQQLATYADYDGPMKQTWEWMVLEAYDRPVERTAEAGEQAAREFASWVFMACLRQYRSQ